ncbi:hypothetical protein BS47DRAFT_1361507 [Hydnum rufescens UP504]|uniref:Uncharacterized protein n=1 Tax=Hydnum rufescens UP504 TaxID=1448309 RepID=A0A9P6DYD1_9AGAM|nr:hypothetical protein BS47DRAFT_1361507 [Hydnum rufescens UP504]
MSGDPGPIGALASDKKQSRALGTSPHQGPHGSQSEMSSGETAPNHMQVPQKIQKTQKAVESTEYIQAEAAQGYSPFKLMGMGLDTDIRTNMDMDMDSSTNVDLSTNMDLSMNVDFRMKGHLLNLYFFLMEAQTHSIKILPDPMMILLECLPNIGAIASEHDYLRTMVLTSYEEWQQFFGVNNFDEFLITDLHFGPAFKDFVKAAIGD